MLTDTTNITSLGTGQHGRMVAWHNMISKTNTVYSITVYWHNYVYLTCYWLMLYYNGKDMYLTCYWLVLYYNVKDIDNLRTVNMSIPWQSGQIRLHLLQVNIDLCWPFSAMPKMAMIYSMPNQGYSRNASMIYSMPNQGYSRNASCALN
jgi:hypothetical protein